MISRELDGLKGLSVGDRNNKIADSRAQMQEIFDRVVAASKEKDLTIN